MRNTPEVWELVDERRESYEKMADTIWGIPEVNYQEFKSAAEHTRMLEKEGFRITQNLAGIPTAIMGEAGSEGPVIAFLGEFDALPGLSQEAGIAEKRPVEADGHGHGCGHNLLGTGALLAAAAVKSYLDRHGLPGRVRYYGCPAEEAGAGKTFMVRDGVFNDVDAVISWHPSPFAGVDRMASLANQTIDFSFVGRAAHAAAAHLGRSALDAVEVMNFGVNYMREHIPSSARVHYAILDAGGIAPNVVQATAKVRYMVRATDLPGLKVLVEWVKKIAEGAALITETSVTHEVISGMSNLIPNEPLSQAMHDNFMRLGPPPFNEADRELARRFQATFRPEHIASTYQRMGMPLPKEPAALCDLIVPLETRSLRNGGGSTDLGDVSWIAPTVYARGATVAIGTPGHSWQLTAQGKAPAAHKGMVHVAKVMAGTAIDVLADPDLLARAKADHAQRIGDGYECPIPGYVPVPLDFASR